MTALAKNKAGVGVRYEPGHEALLAHEEELDPYYEEDFTFDPGAEIRHNEGEHHGLRHGQGNKALMHVYYQHGRQWTLSELDFIEGTRGRSRLLIQVNS